MTRFTLVTLIFLAPSLAAAWGEKGYHSYSSDKSASWTSTSSDKGNQSTTRTTTSGATSVAK